MANPNLVRGDPLDMSNLSPDRNVVVPLGQNGMGFHRIGFGSACTGVVVGMLNTCGSSLSVLLLVLVLWLFVVLAVVWCGDDEHGTKAWHAPATAGCIRYSHVRRLT